MIKVDSLYKYYGSRRAVGPLTAEIKEGEVVGLLGLNGAGKTTTLRILACDLLPSSGTVSVDGLDVVEQPDEVRKLVGYLPDAPPLYEEMSVRRYLAFAAQLRQVKSSDVPKAVEGAARSAGLEEAIDETIASLSHGYRQRVGIAQAIVHQPRLVVLDEPSSGLDPVQIKDMRRLVRSLGGKHTVLVSSHNLPEIAEMCDRLLVMGQGRIVAAGTEAELVERWARGDALRVSVRLPAGTDADAARAWLAAFDGIREVTQLKGEAATFDVAATRELRAELVRGIVEQGWDLLNLSRSERELENVFSKLAFTAADGEQEEAA